MSVSWHQKKKRPLPNIFKVCLVNHPSKTCNKDLIVSYPVIYSAISAATVASFLFDVLFFSVGFSFRAFAVA